MKRVFVTQSPMRRDKDTGDLRQVHDVSPAAEYGSIEVLVPGGPVVLSTQHLVTTLKDKLRDFGDNDYLLCLGDPAVMTIAATLCARVNGGKYTLLIWDRHTAKYLPVPVVL